MLTNKQIEEAQKKYDEIVLNKELNYAIFRRKIARMDKASMEARAEKRGMEQGRQEGIKKGIKQGIQQGMKQGKQQGVIEGRAEGVAETQRKNVLNMHKEGLKVEDISKFLRMEKQEVEKIIKEENEKCRNSKNANCKKERN